MDLNREIANKVFPRFKEEIEQWQKETKETLPNNLEVLKEVEQDLVIINALSNVLKTSPNVKGLREFLIKTAKKNPQEYKEISKYLMDLEAFSLKPKKQVRGKFRAFSN